MQNLILIRKWQFYKRNVLTLGIPGESGIQQLDGMSICTICRKKFKIGGFDER